MYINNITETFLDYPDDSSLAVIVFFEGCNHFCKNCQNPELQVQDRAHKHTMYEAADIILKKLKASNTNKLVFSGGDPFYDTDCAIVLIDYLVSRGFDICVYTGYSLEDILGFYNKYEATYNRGMQKPLYLKCGLFIEDLLDSERGKDRYKFTLATTNQKFYKYVEGKYVQISDKNVLTYGE